MQPSRTDPLILFSGGYNGEIVTLRFNPSSSQLERIATTKNGGEAPTWLTLSPDGKLLFATDEHGGLLTSFAIEDDFSLRFNSAIPVGGDAACHSTLLDTTPRKLLTATYMGELVTSHGIFSGGDFVPDESQVQRLSVTDVGKLGSHETRQEQRHPHGVHLDPKGKTIIVPDLGTDELRVFKVLPDGNLEYVIGGETKLAPGTGPRHCMFAKTRQGKDIMYVMEELGNSVSVFDVNYDGEDESQVPKFRRLQPSVSLLPPEPTAQQSPFEKWHSAEIKITPDSRYLIASNRAEDHDPYNGKREGDPDLFAIFKVNDNGTLDENSKRLTTSFGRAPRHFSLSNESLIAQRQGQKWQSGDELYLAVAHHDSDEIVIAKVGKEAELVEVARLQDVGRPGVVIWA
ncbi:hypothetical protein OIO90_001087 [Microbotryomycetes sp. JL221]|nr:hypothetical protein OIO90_001087 [Microbotryomycetes sp. JL221]